MKNYLLNEKKNDNKIYKCLNRASLHYLNRNSLYISLRTPRIQDMTSLACDDYPYLTLYKIYYLQKVFTYMYCINLFRSELKLVFQVHTFMSF